MEAQLLQPAIVLLPEPSRRDPTLARACQLTLVLGLRVLHDIDIADACKWEYKLRILRPMPQATQR
jgi:hypothetical protein